MYTANFAARVLSVFLLASLVRGSQLEQQAGHGIKVPGQLTHAKNNEDNVKLWTPEVSVHLLTLVETIQTKIETLGVRFGHLESQMSSLQSHMDAVEDRLASKIHDGEQQLGNKTDTAVGVVSNKVNDLESQLAAVEQRVESQILKLSSGVLSVNDKLTATVEKSANRVSRKVMYVKDKVSDSEDKLRLEIGLLKKTMKVKPAENYPSDVSMLGIGRELHNFGRFISDSVDKRLQKLSERFDIGKDEMLSQSKNVTGSLEERINYASDALYVVSRDISENLNNSLQSLRDLIKEDTGNLVVELNNVVSLVYEKIESVTTSLNFVKENITPSFVKLDKLPERVIERMDERLSNFSEGMYQCEADEFEMLNVSLMTRLENMQHSLEQLTYWSDNDAKIELTSCKIGMPKPFAHHPYPYPVVYANIGTSEEKQYLCDTATTGGGWIIIQYRSKGDTDFYRGWEDYKNGFGSLDTDFWIGLEAIYNLTSRGTYELRIDMKYKGQSKFAHYNAFAVESKAENYKLSLGAYHGTAGDSLRLGWHEAMEFTTKDRDNDKRSFVNCAVQWTGAWWYNDCHRSNLNGVWAAGGCKGPDWETFAGPCNPVSFTEMKIRRVYID